MPKQFKLIGEKFGDLLVKECIGLNNNKSKLWLCECVCGNMIKTTSGRLVSGKKTNCGCKSKSRKNLVGQKFGKLTVMRKVGYIGNNVVWLCKCECGNEITERGPFLRKLKTTSCGCSGHGPSLVASNFFDFKVSNHERKPEFYLPTPEEMEKIDKKFLLIDLIRKGYNAKKI